MCYNLDICLGEGEWIVHLVLIHIRDEKDNYDGV